MTEIQDPGAPESSDAARVTAARSLSVVIQNGPVDLSEDGVGNAEENAYRIANEIVKRYPVTWERDVDAVGRPLRRFVLRGAWAEATDEVTPFADRHGLRSPESLPAAITAAQISQAVADGIETVFERRNEVVASVLRAVYERINMMVTSDPVSDALDAIRAEADGRGVTL
jgi:hypothetical protein